jgi:putative peptidoglycan lipid II flippase
MNSFQKSFSLLFFLSATGYVLSFGNQLVVSYHFGTSVALDAYWALFAVANFLLFYVQPLREALVPPVFTAVADDREPASALFTAGLVLQVLLALLSMTLLLMAPSNLLDRFGVHNSDSLGLWLVFLPFFILFAMAETCNGLLLSFNQAVYQAVARLASALLGLVCLWVLAGHIGVLALLFSLLIAQVTTLLISALGLYREGIRWVWRGLDPLWRETRFKTVFSALLLNYFLAQTYVVFERFTMLSLQPGLVASFQYSVALVNVLISLLAFPLSNLLWPRFLAQAALGDSDAMLNAAARVVVPLVLVLLACSCFAEQFSQEIVQLLFARGSFDEVSVAQTSQALRATVFAAIPVSLFTIYSRILFSQGRGRAIAAGGISIALSGSGVVLLAGLLGSVSLVQWHWAIGNTVGLLVIFYVLLRNSSDPMSHIRGAWALSWRAGIAVSGALWVTPEIAPTNAIEEIFFGLCLSLVIFSGSFSILAYLMSVLHLPARLGYRS